MVSFFSVLAAHSRRPNSQVSITSSKSPSTACTGVANLPTRQKFEHYVWRLNRGSGRNVQYKVLYLGRHGEGYHNVAESYYGTPLWNVRAFPPLEPFPSFSMFPQ